MAEVDDDVGAALTGAAAAFKNARRSPNIIDRRDEKSFQMGEEPSFGGMLRFYGIPTENIPPKRTNNPMAKALGYNDIHKPTPEEMQNFLMYIDDLDKEHAAEDFDPIGGLIKRLNEPIARR